MKESKALIEEFYSAFQRRDWKTMQDCYHADVLFSDPVFPDLKGTRAKAMWHMLTEAARDDFRLTFKNINADNGKGSCDWDAWYTFSKTGRKVHNIIRASFEFEDNKIVRHVDSFNLWRWSGMALGIPGKLLGWSPIIRNKIRSTAEFNLGKFIGGHPEYRS